MLSEFEVAKHLLKINAIKLNPGNPFVWASGLKSPIYCDNRKILSYPELRSKIHEGLMALAITFDNLEAVSGVATAGIAHGMMVASMLELPFSYVRSSAKSHGAQNQIEGEIPIGKRCIVIEDLISTGLSSLKAVEVLREEQVNVLGVISIFSYQLKKAEENFSKYACDQKSLSNYGALLEAAQNNSMFSSDELVSLQSWRNDPEGWSKNFHS